MEEKYVATSDPYTGVHPFMPCPPKSKGIITTLKNNLLAPIIFLLRLPFILVFGGLMLAFDALSELVPTSFLKRFVRRFGNKVFGGLLLMTLGFRIDVSNYPSKSKEKFNYKVSSGDLIICNHSSYIDLLYFAYMYSPQYTSIASSGLTVRPVSLLTALSEIIYNHQSTAQGIPLSKLVALCAQNNLGPVLLFPEGTPTNGRIMIGPLPVIDTIPDPKTVNCIGIRYPYKYFSPSYSAGSFLWHFVRLAGQIFNHMEVVHSMPSVVPKGEHRDALRWLHETLDVIGAGSKLSQGKILRTVKQQFWDKYHGK